MPRHQCAQHCRTCPQQEPRSPPPDLEPRHRAPPPSVCQQQRAVAPPAPADHIERAVQHAHRAPPIARRDRFVDVVRHQLVLGLLDHMPQNERGDARVRAAEQLDPVAHQPVGQPQGHRLEPRRIGQPHRQRALQQPRIGSRHLGLDRGQTFVALPQQHIVEPAVRAVMLCFLHAEVARFAPHRRVRDQLRRLPQRRDKERLQMRHHKRRAIDHLREFGRMRDPVRRRILGKSKAALPNGNRGNRPRTMSFAAAAFTFDADHYPLPALDRLNNDVMRKLYHWNFSLQAGTY